MDERVARRQNTVDAEAATLTELENIAMNFTRDQNLALQTWQGLTTRLNDVVSTTSLVAAQALHLRAQYDGQRSISSISPSSKHLSSVEAGLKRSTAVLRQKQMFELLAQTLHKLGDVNLINGGDQFAQHYNDTLDVIFGKYQVRVCVCMLVCTTVEFGWCGHELQASLPFTLRHQTRGCPNVGVGQLEWRCARSTGLGTGQRARRFPSDF